MGVLVVDLTTAAHRLAELVEEAERCGEVILTRDGEAVARIVPLQPLRPLVAPRRPGSARGLIHMADDFDATPEDFDA